MEYTVAKHNPLAIMLTLNYLPVKANFFIPLPILGLNSLPCGFPVWENSTGLGFPTDIPIARNK